MSPLVITLLVGGAIVILLVLAYIKHSIDSSKLEKARQRAELLDRMQRCQDVADRLPGQLMSAPLKLMLRKLELQYAERLLNMERSNAAIKAQVEDIRADIGKGQAIGFDSTPHVISTEAKAKEIRFTLETLHNLITNSAKANLITASEAKHWLKQTRQMLVQVHIEYFTTLGQTSLQQNNPGHARLAYERAVQYLRKQPDVGAYQAQLARFEEQLARANAMVLQKNASQASQDSELTANLPTIEEDWKKKNIYD